MSSPPDLYLARHPHRRSPAGTPEDDGIRVDTHRGSGPGGQKRNKTSSAARAVHPETGLWAASDETRNQHRNKDLAIARLRHELAVKVRRRVYLDRLGDPDELGGWDPGWVELGRKDPRYLAVLGHAIDVLHASGYVLATAADKLGTSTARLSRLLVDDDVARDWVNKKRADVGLKPLR